MPPESLVNLACGGVGAIIVLLWVAWMFSTNQWHSAREFDRVSQALADSLLANRTLQQANEIANARGDAGTQAAEVANAIFRAIQQGKEAGP